MSARPIDPLDAFIREARVIAFHAADHGSWRLYERLKATYQARFPEHDHVQHERTVRELARIAGV